MTTQYISYIVGFGKAYFLSTFFQYAPFISGDCYTGKLSDTDAGSRQSGLLSFFRLVGSLYFKKYVSQFLPDYVSPVDLFKSIMDTNSEKSDLDIHILFLNAIREYIQPQVVCEDEILPSHTALQHHWYRSCLVSQMYAASVNNIIDMPSFVDYGFSISGDHLSPIWDNPEYMDQVKEHVNELLFGCKCTKGCSTRRCKCKKTNQYSCSGCRCKNGTNNDQNPSETEIERIEPKDI